ncbi:MAG: phosphoribosylamine--glycine ligase [Anaerolineaceae bacterium]
MNVLVIGSGGREHALVWKISQSSILTKLYALPGNPGNAELAENVEGISVDDHAAVAAFCKHSRIDLAIIGPEAPLAAGLADALRLDGIRCFGPGQAAARIESSKVFAKDFMARHHIPTARYACFRRIEDAVRHLESVDYPVVIKASGLAAGKGVILPGTMDEARSALKAILVEKAFGEAGDEVVIEERLEGPEVSLMAFTDGQTVLPMLPAQDHKRLLDGDAGPNTGGMGAYAPAPVFTPQMVEQAVEELLKPAVLGLKQEGAPFVGVLYAGLMLTTHGVRVLEFNGRFGDPETQVVLPLLESDLLEILEACVDGRLSEIDLRWKQGAAVCVVLASKGYPEKPETGKIVTFQNLPDGMACFHAGTRADGAGCVLTSGGRVFGLTAWDSSIAGAVETVYAHTGRVSFDGMQFRKDIAHRALKGSV